ncbi:putative fungal specific transcription factor [Lyophyllum shimeji]|uniref:Fungal specific transcription factor n=1 Tax=Lyophyllum shimeji TaxID=47721 RepID=A0A9P3PTJ9_LYOSH|nr:putative fungal specific transcription factor [Lyophyllum shimeji]
MRNSHCTSHENRWNCKKTLKRGPPKSYVERLENRVQRLQDLIGKLSPEALECLDTFFDSPLLSTHPPITSKQPDSTLAQHDPTPARFIRHLGSDIARPAASEEDDKDGFLIDQLEKLSIDTHQQRFCGKSSGVTLIKAALELKREYLGTKGESRLVGEGGIDLSDPRKQWPQPPPNPPSPPPKYSYPPPDLLASLIDLYFAHVNTYLPLLHRPTFEREVAQGLHLENISFAKNLLLVCAVASRFSDDPRVMDDAGHDAHSAGWKWFVQMSLVNASPLNPPNIYDIQFYALLGQFLQASSVPQACWTIVGAGIRAAQDVGVHRRKKNRVHTVEDELWKRAFWVLLCMDRLFSSSLGRPCAIHDEDFDLDMPIECDDEYWEHPDPQLRWRQPTPHKTPSIITYFNSYIRLNQILAFLLRTVYAINKSKILLGFVGQQWEENIVSELDSALNTWIDSLPDHLRWDPTRTHDVFFNQSASLHCAWYHIQILVHRPFIPSPRKPNAALTFPSLAICTNAARACCNILDAQRKRFKVAPPPLQTTAFSAGVVLLLSIWGGKRSGLSTDFNKEMANVQKCMEVLKGAETRWYVAGRLHDILSELASVGDRRLPQHLSDSATKTTAQKRDREPEEEEVSAPPASVATSHNEPSMQGRSSYITDATLNITGQTQSSANQRPAPSGGARSVFTQPSPFSQQMLYTLPEYSFDPRPNAMQHPQQQQQFEQRRPPQPPPSYQQVQALHRPMEPQPAWYGASNVGSPGFSRAHDSHVQPHAVSVSPTYLPQGHSQMHIPPTSMAGASSGSSYASAYSAPSTADFGTMSPFVIQTGQPGARHGQQQGYSYRVAHEMDAGGHGGLGMPVGGSADLYTGGGVGGMDASGSGTGTGTGMSVDDALAMWSEAPAGFELNEWGDYVSNINGATTSARHILLPGNFSLAMGPMPMYVLLRLQALNYYAPELTNLSERVPRFIYSDPVSAQEELGACIDTVSASTALLGIAIHELGPEDAFSVSPSTPTGPSLRLHQASPSTLP